MTVAPQRIERSSSPDHEGHLAAIVVLVLIPFAVYVAFWTDVFAGYTVAKIGFIVIAPSVIGSTVEALRNAVHSSRESGEVPTA